MNINSKAYMIGGGIGSLAAAAFLIRDGNIPGGNITILEAAPVLGGPLDGAGDADCGTLMGISRQVLPVTPHAQSPHAQFDALLKAFK